MRCFGSRRVHEDTSRTGRSASIVVSIATAGDLLQWHPHEHILVTDGAFSDDGVFHPLETWDGDVVMKLFRESLLARLVERHAISEGLVRKLLAVNLGRAISRRSDGPRGDSGVAPPALSHARRRG
jgi:Putative transposase